MAIIGSDFHGSWDKVKRFLAYKPEEAHIFAGDILDSHRLPFEVQVKALDELLNSTCILLWGNHEQNYWKERKPCSGYQYDVADIYTKILEANRKRFKNAVEFDGYLITHAGLGSTFNVPTLLKDCTKFLNKNQNEIYKIGYYRGGTSPQGGIFWFDYRYDHGTLHKGFNQVFGHCSSEKPWEDKGEGYHHVCVNTWDDSPALWVFNTATKELEEVV